MERGEQRETSEEDSEEEEPQESNTHLGAVKTIQHLPNEVLLEVFSFLPLEDLVLGVKQVCRRWRALADDGKLFKELVYRPNIRDSSEEHVIRVLRSAPKLRWIVLGSSRTRRVLDTLCKSCKDLRQVDLTSPHLGMLGPIADSCRKLERIDVITLGIHSPDTLMPLGRCCSLKDLRLQMLEVPNGVFSSIAEDCPMLERLQMTIVDYVADDLSYLMKKRGYRLNFLRLECCSGGYCLLPLVVLHCKQLRTLSVFGHSGNTESLTAFFRTTAAAVLRTFEILAIQDLDRQTAEALFKQCANLTSLKIMCSGTIDELLTGIAQLTNLESLDLSHCIKLTDSGVMHITGCTKLRELLLNQCRSTSNVSFHFCCENLPDLHTLEMNRTKVSSESLLIIPHLLKKLKHLTICGCNLQESIDSVRSCMPGLEVVQVDFLDSEFDFYSVYEHIYYDL